MLADVRQELDDIVAEERAGIERRLDEAATPPDGSPDATRPSGRCSATPPPAGSTSSTRCRGTSAAGSAKLEEYDFMEPEARDRFNALTERLRKQTLDRFVDGLSEAIQGTTPEDLAANREMVRDLNELLEQRLEGREPSQDQVDDFLSQHGRFFPGARTLDDIVEQLTERMAAMASLLRSMTPQQRAELEVDDGRAAPRRPAALGPRPARVEHGPADARRPRRGLRVQRRAAARARAGARPDRPAPGARRLEDQLGDDRIAGRPRRPRPRRGRASCSGRTSARDLEALDELARQLEEAGYLSRKGDRLELTPRGSRRIGQKVLDDLFARLSRDAFGGHRIDRSGRGGEREETTKPYEFGDPFHLDIRGTIENALRRPENAPTSGSPAASPASTSRRRTSRSSGPSS